jgi:DNA primase
MNFIDYIVRNYNHKFVGDGREIQVYHCPNCGRDKYDTRVYFSVETYLGFCHHCQTKFTAITYIMKDKGLSFNQARKFLDELDNDFIIDVNLNNDSPTIDCKDDVLLPPDMVKAFNSEKARRYLLSRGVDEQLSEKFRIKYCPYNLTIGDKVFKTANRVLFPIYNIDGKLTSWVARSIYSNVVPKYLFPIGFKSAEHLYNINNITDDNYIILCEGVFDVIGWVRAGIDNAVASFGKKFSDEQLKILLKLKKDNLFIAFDSDAKKEKYELGMKLKDYFNVRIVDFDGKDSDELPKSTLNNCLLNARPTSLDILL